MTNYLALAVTTTKPSRGTMAGMNRAEKVAEMRRCTGERAAEIVQWLTDQQLADQIGRVVADNAMNVIFIEATPEVKRRLADAPNVIGVSVVSRLPVTLMEHS